MSSSTRTSSARFRIVIATLGCATAVSLATGCGPNLAGSAAVIGDSRITDETLVSQSNALTAALEIPPSAKVNQFLLDRDLKQELVSRLAEKHGVDITPGQIAAFLDEQYQLGGGKEQTLAQLEQQGITADALDAVVLTQLQVVAIGQALLPNGTEEQQSKAVLAAAIELSDQLNVTVSPRFGQWDAEKLGVIPAPNDLSAPPPVTESPEQLSELQLQQ